MSFNYRLPLPQNGDMDVVTMLLDYGADPSTQGADIWSGVLYNAISSGDIEIVRLLLDKGIDVELLHNALL